MADPTRVGHFFVSHQTRSSPTIMPLRELVFFIMKYQHVTTTEAKWFVHGIQFALRQVA